MNSLSKKHSPALLILILANAVLFGFVLKPEASVSESDAPYAKTQVPAVIGDWKGVTQEVDEKTVQILETDDIAVMEYVKEGEEAVWFAQVSGFGKRAAFHPPELCFVGSHFEVVERDPYVLTINGKDHEVMRLVIGQDGLLFEAWYWFTANQRVTANYYQQQLWLMLDAMTGKGISGKLVRLSTAMDKNNPEVSRNRLESFVSSFQSQDIN